MTDLPRNAGQRVERARADFVKGVVRKDAPGMLYYPTLTELAQAYDVNAENLAMICKRDDWLTDRGEAMTYSAIVPFSAAVDADPKVVSRAVVVAEAIEAIDDSVFHLAKRGLEIARLAMEALEADAEDDPVKAIRALRSVSQTMESLHRTAKQAYDPASVRPENSVTINVQNVAASDDVVIRTAELLARMEQQARAAGIEIENIEEADIVDEEGETNE